MTARSVDYIPEEDKKLLAEEDDLCDSILAEIEGDNPGDKLTIERMVDVVNEQVEAEIKGQVSTIEEIASYVAATTEIGGIEDNEASRQDKADKTRMTIELSNLLGSMYDDCKLYAGGHSSPQGIVTRALGAASLITGLIPGAKAVSTGIKIAKKVSAAIDTAEASAMAEKVLNISGARISDSGPVVDFFVDLSKFLSEVYSPQLKEALAKSDKPKEGFFAKLLDKAKAEYDSALGKPTSEEENRADRQEKKRASQIKQFAYNLRNEVCAVMVGEPFQDLVKSSVVENLIGVQSDEIKHKFLVHIARDIINAERRETLLEKVQHRAKLKGKIVLAHKSQVPQRLGMTGAELQLDESSRAEGVEYVEALQKMGANPLGKDDFIDTLKVARNDLRSHPKEKVAEYAGGYDFLDAEPEKEEVLKLSKDDPYVEEDQESVATDTDNDSVSISDSESDSEDIEQDRKLEESSSMVDKLRRTVKRTSFSDMIKEEQNQQAQKSGGREQ